MQANELRIGNWVKLKDAPHNQKESQYQIKEIVCYLNSYLTELEEGHIVPIKTDLEPIPLTEEWLVKFGFHPSTEPLRFIHETLDVEIEKQGNYFAVVIWNEECPAISNFILHSQYVHEFQNKIFALTQTELTFK